MAQLFDAVPANDMPDVPNYNVCPTTGIHVVMTDDTRRLVKMRWGFLPHWYKTPTDGPLLINARAETIAEKPAFRDACRARRCLIPISGFYEWTKDQEGKRWPWYIQGPQTLALAGIWQDWGPEEDRQRTCAVVTTQANDSMSKVHHRMPVIISAENWGLWLGEAGFGAAPLMKAADNDLLSFYQVDPKVNSNRAQGPDLIAPLPN